MVRSRHGMHRHSKSAQFTIAGWLIITPFRAQQCGALVSPHRYLKRFAASNILLPSLRPYFLFACLLAIMITDIFEKWQPSFQLQRREIVTITAATTAVIAAKTLYSLAQQVHGKRVRFALSVI